MIWAKKTSLLMLAVVLGRASCVTQVKTRDELDVLPRDKGFEWRLKGRGGAASVANRSYGG